MRRAAVLLGGLLAGFVAGSLLPVSTVVAMFSSTPVTWNAASCAPGIYTIISTAQRVGSGDTYRTAAARIRLPQASVTQEFENLPPGTYAVTATLRDARGRTFESGLQTVTRAEAIGARGGSAPRAAVGGTAKPRGRASSAPPASGTHAEALRGQAASPMPMAAIPGSPNAMPGTASRAVSRAKPDIESLIGRLTQIADLTGGGADWQRIDLVDSDDDGTTVLLRIEWSNGTVRTWRVTR